MTNTNVLGSKNKNKGAGVLLKKPRHKDGSAATMWLWTDTTEH